MKYKRNSGRRTQKIPKGEEAKIITEIGSRLKEDEKWLEELNDLNQFSSEWVHKVAVELLFQCMGKKSILSGFKGQEKEIYLFKEKPALDALAMIAKMNGHLFDTIKGTVKQTGTIDHNHEHQGQIELKPDTNRTNEVFNILEACGALNSPKRLTKDDVEVISA
jgi:hypothetical protein